MTTLTTVVFAYYFRSVFMCAERSCLAKINSGEVPGAAVL